MGERRKDALRVNSDRKLKLEFQGTKVTSDAGLLAYRELDAGYFIFQMAEVAPKDSRLAHDMRLDLDRAQHLGENSGRRADGSCVSDQQSAWLLAFLSQQKTRGNSPDMIVSSASRYTWTGKGQVIESSRRFMVGVGANSFGRSASSCRRAADERAVR